MLLCLRQSAVVLTVFCCILLYSGDCELRALTSCICLGFEAIFECVVSDPDVGATLWQGTALEECPENRIILRHSQFTRNDDYSIRARCGSKGEIIGRAVSVLNDTYVSQLTIAVSQELNDSTIDCGGRESNYTESISLTLSNNLESVPLPENIIIAEMTVDNITFTFTLPNKTKNCPAIHYHIYSKNCGQCPNITMTNLFICTLSESIMDQECSISLSSVLCGSIYGKMNVSTSFIVPASPRDFMRNTSDDTLPSETIFEYTTTLIYSDNTTNVNKFFLIGGMVLAIALSLIAIVVVSITLYFKLLVGKPCKQSTIEQVSLSDTVTVNAPDTEANEQGNVVYSLLGPSNSDKFTMINNLLYNTTVHDETEDNSVENYNQTTPTTESVAVYENRFNGIDNSLNLDTLLIQIRSQVTPKWYHFGKAVGINKEKLDELSNLPPKESTVEMLDLWLRTRKIPPTWRDLADVLKRIGLYLLAEKILKIYKFGKVKNEHISHIDETLSDDEFSICPPLPPKAYECTSEL